MDKLPQPATNADFYGYAVVMELRQIHQALAQLTALVQAVLETPEPEPVPSDEVPLKEPAKPPHRDAKKGKKDADSAD